MSRDELYATLLLLVGPPPDMGLLRSSFMITRLWQWRTAVRRTLEQIYENPGYDILVIDSGRYEAWCRNERALSSVRVTTLVTHEGE